jgi:hypothetical protein
MIDKEKIKAEIRPYEEKDRDAVRKICCDTGFMGDPVDTLFCDREIFADFFTSYYTDNEPENAMVAEVDGEVIGYIIGCLNHKAYPLKQAMIVIKKIPTVIWRIISGKYDKQTLKFIKWFLTKANSETPDAPKNAAHFHVNLLNGYRQGFLVISHFYKTKKFLSSMDNSRHTKKTDVRTKFLRDMVLNFMIAERSQNSKILAKQESTFQQLL